jgi:hypothetical protein
MRQRQVKEENRTDVNGVKVVEDDGEIEIVRAPKPSGNVSFLKKTEVSI